MKTTKMTMADVRAQHTGYFFSRSNMRMFASRVESSLYKNGCFITSERVGYESSKRAYTVRRFNAGSIDTVSQFLQFQDISDARAFARAYVGGER